MKRFKFIVCGVMQKEAYLCAARSKNIVDVILLEQGLHNEPDRLRSELQKTLEVTCDIKGREYDTILLGYGLCSNGIVGLSSKLPVIVPRGHDCITLLLGSAKCYKEYFDSHRGVYWYSTGWIETNTQPGKQRYQRTLQEYRDKYGDDNAEYLMELEQSWMKEYQRATYIDWSFANSENQKDYTKKCAEFMGWNYDCVEGNSGLMQRLVDGDWNEDEYLIVQPGETIVEDLTTDKIIRAE
ncbi:MAG: DUF1638 domain-containing protein [Phycisphaerae bacterium]|nr:DUF1638 domain-containing protein [Phycisphaerae bacterium]